MFVMFLVPWLGELEALVTNWWCWLPSILAGYVRYAYGDLQIGKKVHQRM